MFLVQITRIFSFIKKNLWKVRNSKRVAAINSNKKTEEIRILPSAWHVFPRGFMGSVCCILHGFLSEQQQTPWCLVGDGTGGSPSIILVESVVPACVHMQW